MPYPMSSSPTGRMQLPPSTLHLRQLWLISSTPSGAKLHVLRTALAAALASATAVLTAAASQPTASSSDPSTTVLLCALTVGTPCPSVALPPTLRRGPEPRLRQAGFERSSRHVGPAGGAPGGAISSTRRRRAGRDPGERRRRKSARTGGGYQASFMMWITSSNRARPVAVLAKGARFCLLLFLPSCSCARTHAHSSGR